MTALARMVMEDPAVARVRARAGVTIREGMFQYIVTPDGEFQITNAPQELYERTVGMRISSTCKLAQAWAILADILERIDDVRSPTPDPERWTPAGRAANPAKPPPLDPFATSQRDWKRPTPRPSLANMYWVTTTSCVVRDEQGTRVGRPLERYSHVRVLATKRLRDFTNAKVAHSNGTVIGWIDLACTAPLRRPSRPSTSAWQMAAVHAQARLRCSERKQDGDGFSFVKANILDAGGYGDLLDLMYDERFDGDNTFAVHFPRAVRRWGAAALGLEKFTGLPTQAPLGTLLILRGNGKARIDMVRGDAAIIEGVSDNKLIAYNDGRLELDASHESWSTGELAGTVVAMYKPIDRA